MKRFTTLKKRCTDPKGKDYSNYGGRGILFLFLTFEEFYRELGPRPSRKHTVDRKNNDGNYEAGNIRWTTRKEQNANQRKRKNCDSRMKYVCKTSYGKWRVVVPVNGCQIHLGSFRDEHTAIERLKQWQQ